MLFSLHELCWLTVSRLGDVGCKPGLKEAQAAVEGTPFTAKEAAAEKEAEELKKQLEEAGAKVELRIKIYNQHKRLFNLHSKTFSL